MDHDRTGGAVLLGLLELVGPATVVGARRAAEQLLAVLLDRRIADGEIVGT